MHANNKVHKLRRTGQAGRQEEITSAAGELCRSATAICPTDPNAAAFGGSAQAIGAAQAAAAISNGRSRSFAADQLHLRLTDHANPRPICLGS